MLSILPFVIFFFLIPRPPRPPLFPYTTLFRSIISSQVCSPQRTSRVGSGLAGLWAELSKWATHSIRVPWGIALRSEEHTSELQSLRHLVCRLLLEKKKNDTETDYEQAAETHRR